MSLRARIVVAELLGTMILILGGPGTVIFAEILFTALFVFPIIGGAVAAGLWRVLAPGDEIVPSPAA
jgi:glycerol uptake facilitator-like aquaporin